VYRLPTARRLLVALPALVIGRPTAVRASITPPANVVSTSDSSDAAQAVKRFHAALAEGDSVTALRLLAPDARILESGDTESREEYRRHHLPADIAFARAVPSTHAVHGVVVMGDVAWVSATSESKGTWNGRAVNSVGAELVVLSRDPHAAHAAPRGAAPWVIRAIHWSSRRGKS
jgi:ketosteroid isomerase-like protein